MDMETYLIIRKKIVSWLVSKGYTRTEIAKMYNRVDQCAIVATKKSLHYKVVWALINRR